MYKDLEVLGKEKFKDIKFDTVDVAEVGKSIGLVPVGFLEVTDMGSIVPVVIMGGENEMEFIGLFSLSNEMSVFNKQSLLNPLYLRTYPFVNVRAKAEDDTVSNVIGIDVNSECVGEDKTVSIFDDKGELTNEANAKVEMVRELNRQRDISKNIIKALKDNDLLIEKDFKIKAGEEEKTILENFYMVDREKLYALDDALLLEWAKKGWLTLIDCHIKSLRNFVNLVTQ